MLWKDFTSVVLSKLISNFQSDSIYSLRLINMKRKVSIRKKRKKKRKRNQSNKKAKSNRKKERRMKIKKKQPLKIKKRILKKIRNKSSNNLKRNKNQNQKWNMNKNKNRNKLLRNINMMESNLVKKFSLRMSWMKRNLFGKSIILREALKDQLSFIELSLDP